MNVSLTLSVLIALAGAGAAAAQGPARAHPLPVVTPQALTTPQAERQAALAWARGGRAHPITGPDGELLYPYGTVHPTVVCAPLHVCVIRFGVGEQIASISIGDSVRWRVQPTAAGTQPLLVIKPTTAGLSTNLVVATTSGRVYYLNLVSAWHQYVPEIGFYYPEDLVETLKRQAAHTAATTVAVLPAGEGAQLDFHYWASGPRRYRPVRMFSQAGHVYIQMPADIRYHNAPTLFVVEGGKRSLVNYRFSGHYYIVDQLFRKAELVLGVGDDARIETLHAGKRPFWR